MSEGAPRPTATVGVSDHGGWAVLVSVALDGTLIDRRRVELVEEGVPKLPHHHDGQGLAVSDAVALVERVRLSAEVCSRARLAELARDVPARMVGIALRACPPLPDTVEARLSDYRARNVADWVMYRNELARAAEARGWSVHWFDAKRVFDDAARALGRQTIQDLLAKTGAALGPPWQKDHQLAMAAAIAACERTASSPSSGAS